MIVPGSNDLDETLRQVSYDAETHERGRPMNLLFKRSQSSGAGGVADAMGVPVPGGIPGVGPRPKFKLWAKVELEPDEQKVIDHYHFDKYILIDSIQPDLLRFTAYVAGATLVVSFMIFWTMAKSDTAAFLAVLAAGGAAYFYYDKHRETIFVRDLLHGRYFSCKSIIELARKEAWLETVTAFLRQVMESAKHWDGTETIKVPVLDKEEAKRIVIKGL